MEKIVEREKAFGNMLASSSNVYLAEKDKSKPHNYLRGENNKRERGHGRRRKSFRSRGVDTTKVIDPIFIIPVAKRMGHIH